MAKTDRVLSVGMVGAGQVSRFHLAGWARAEGAKVVAIQDMAPARAEERAREYGIAACYADLAEMLDREKLDALDITAATGAHRAACLMAAERGIAVMCQKPLTGSLAGAERLVDEMEGRVPFMVHENWRFRPQYRQLAAWIAEGRVGEIRQFQFSGKSSGLIRTHPDEPPPLLQRQPFIAELPREIVLEVLIHHLDTLRFLVGQRMEVRDAILRRRSPDIVGEDFACILLTAANGAVGTLIADQCVPGAPASMEDRLEIVGDRGRVCFESNATTLYGDGEPTRVEFDLAAAYLASFANTIAHFVACLREGRPFESSARDNLESFRLVEAVYAAAGPLS
ncbi:MAG: Gfo/Idh/MocA family protein [Flavobacteriaceae bacterium]